MGGALARVPGVTYDRSLFSSESMIHEDESYNLVRNMKSPCQLDYLHIQNKQPYFLYLNLL
ncbi:hypothetical protein HanXRQr2_Chr16g0759711 [Helianthus annuus]|uniref:Uncharacterized protein n=1 Tax=Helianthus annuus TaxID=4232 RepID=A0A9K3GZK3_HELAN|nr:hypothetical protein HanXRQr2_Chr16g0759711 [Helianthus annuus]KAJ0822099.1 hypothetical protein HanPSC8_Chr16g0727991 [Helianthus annuus]